MDSRAGGVKRSLPGGVRRGQKGQSGDGLAGASLSPGETSAAAYRRRGLKRRGAEVVLTACRRHDWSDLQATNGTVFASMDA